MVETPGVAFLGVGPLVGLVITALDNLRKSFLEPRPREWHKDLSSPTFFGPAHLGKMRLAMLFLYSGSR